ncbi:MAG: LamG domain-containing protein [Deltaproteobacteria bacterium]|nr:LamG domain-containing protein [Deltaproteobacteria bacterium]
MSARVGFVIALACSAACSFEGQGIVPRDGGVDAPDAAIDAPDAPGSDRVQDGLVALWTFNEVNGSLVAGETSGRSPAVPLAVIDDAITTAPTFASGRLTLTTIGRLRSAMNTRLAGECSTAVTLEAWVMTDRLTQGSAVEGRVIAGLAPSAGLRDIMVLQAGDRWVGRVRTSALTDGKPELVSTSKVVVNAMTHLVLVAEGTRRTLYVDDVPEGGVGMMGAPVNWDLSYPMVLANEYQQERPWVGTFALVALYGKALTPAEIHQNFMLGPDAP